MKWKTLPGAKAYGFRGESGASQGGRMGYIALQGFHGSIDDGTELVHRKRHQGALTAKIRRAKGRYSGITGRTTTHGWRLEAGGRRQEAGGGRR